MTDAQKEAARELVYESFRDELEPDGHNRGYICPICGSGTGRKGTGITENPKSPDHFTCWAGCFTNADAFAIIAKMEKLEPGSRAAMEAAYKRYGINPLTLKVTEQHITHNVQKKQKPQQEQKQYDFSEYYKTCMERITDPAAVEYLKQRGISLDTAQMYVLGYDPAWTHPDSPTQRPHPCLIIPTSRESYVARGIVPGEKFYGKAGNVNHFNQSALYDKEQPNPVFVTEGEMDAISIIEAGGKAVALGSTSMVDKFENALLLSSATLILSLDNDEPGQKATENLVSILKKRVIPYIIANISGTHKDPNEALTADRAAFEQAVADAQGKVYKMHKEQEEQKQHNAQETVIEDALQEREQPMEIKTTAPMEPDSSTMEATREAVEEVQEKQRRNVADYITHYMGEDMRRFKEGATRTTGYEELDMKAGGIYPGLYVVGAISSLGKTTFIHQMADQMAGTSDKVKCKSHIMFFSLEQSRLELVSKSLARWSAIEDPAHVFTNLQVRRGEFDNTIPGKYIEKVGDRFNIIEGNFKTNIYTIRKDVEEYIDRTGEHPVIIVDYLQILQGDPAQARRTTKELTDTNVTELKRMSRDLDIPVFVISSLNRANYMTPVDFESFKESGGIEYTADVIWGLQLSVLNDEIFGKEGNIKEKREKIRKAKAGEDTAGVRKIQLVCLKNRYGVSSFTVDFNYFPSMDLFEEDREAQNLF